MKNLKEILKKQVVFQGNKIFEAGLKFGLKFSETAGDCDDTLFMDVVLNNEFPEIRMTVTKDRHGEWKITSGTIGYDGLSIFDNDLIAGYVLQRLGKEYIPVIDFKATFDNRSGSQLKSGMYQDGLCYIDCEVEDGILLTWEDYADLLYYM